MRSILSRFPTENIVLHKASGEVLSKIKALVEPKKIFIDDASVIIEEGDFFERTLSNGAKEYFRVTERGFYKGDHGIPDHYQTQVSKVSKAEMDNALSNVIHEESKRKPQKLFISHSSKDKAYIEAFVDLLEGIGMPDDTIVCTSVPGHGIPGGAKIYDWLREQFVSCDLRVVFALSKNYYDSPASLNEMGAAWITKATDTLILLPRFEFGDIKGCIDPREIGIKLDGDEGELRHRLDELKDTLINEHSLQNITAARWERHRNGFIRKVREIAEKQKAGEESDTKQTHDSIAKGTAGDRIPDNIPVEPAFLVVYAASSNGQIIKVQSLGAGTTISAAGKGFMKDHSPREIARWQGALNNLIAWRWVKSAGMKGEIFELTDLGFKMADMLKDRMDIDTNKEPLEQLEEFVE